MIEEQIKNGLARGHGLSLVAGDDSSNRIIASKDSDVFRAKSKAGASPNENEFRTSLQAPFTAYSPVTDLDGNFHEVSNVKQALADDHKDGASDNLESLVGDTGADFESEDDLMADNASSCAQ